MKKTQEIQPVLLKMQEKYKDNQQKLAEEMQKLYQKEQVNPFAGCLLLLIQLPIIYAMFFAIAEPVKFMYPEIITPEVMSGIEEYADRGAYKELYYIVNERKDLIQTNFLGLDLGQVPTWDSWVTWIIPLLSGIATYLSSYISKRQSQKAGGTNEQAEAMQNNMMIMMPVLITFISFKVPLGMALYWLVNTTISVLLQVWMIKKLNAEGKVVVK